MTYSMNMQNSSVPFIWKSAIFNRLGHGKKVGFAHINKASEKAYTIYISDIGAGLKMRTMLPVQYQVINGKYCISFKKGYLLIIVEEESSNAMADEFRDELRSAWEYYALEDDNNLTENARTIKYWLLKNMVQEG